MSSGSESDDEYVPGAPEQVSEEESADEETDQLYEKELEHKTKKRKAAEKNKGKKKRKTRNGVLEAVVETKVEEKVPEPELDPVEEKKREDDLWAKFLEGTDTKPKPKELASQSEKPVSVDSKDNSKSTKQTKDDQIERERRIFEFAGETIVVEDNVIKEKIKTAESPAAGRMPYLFTRFNILILIVMICFNIKDKSIRKSACFRKFYKYHCHCDGL